MTHSLRDEIAKELFLDNFSPQKTNAELEKMADGCINVANMFCQKLLTNAQTKGCPKCFGSGGKLAAPCKNCNGSGKVAKL